MKHATLLLSAAVLGSLAHAAPVLIGNGDFETPDGASWAFAEANGHTVSYPATGGNPGGHAVINGLAASQTWFAVLIANNDAPVSLSSLGLQAGKRYKFSMDMKLLSGSKIGGLKLDWAQGGSTGEKFPTMIGDGSTWQSYEFEFDIPPGTTGFKVVPLWGSNSEVAFDNIRVENTPVQIIPVVPNGGFETPAGADWAYYTDGFGLSYPTTGGNPGGHAVIDGTAGGNWAVLVAFNNTEKPLAALGLEAGKTYTFQMDMMNLAGPNVGGLKLEGPAGYVYESRPAPAAPTGQWATYSFQVTFPANLNQFKIVPLWGINSKVAYDNVRILLPEPPAPPKATIEPGALVNWTAASQMNSYQVQESNDQSQWSAVGDPFAGNAVASTFDASPSRFYRVVESEPAFANAVFNPGFESFDFSSSPADNWNVLSATNGGSISCAGSYDGGFVPNSGSEMLVIESTTPAEGPVAAPNTDVRSDAFPVVGGTQYTLSFRAANIVKIGGANPQFSLFFYDEFNNFINPPVFESFASVGSTWTTVTKNFTAPANAASMTVGWIQAMGAGNNWKWVTLIDDVSVPTAVQSAPGTPIAANHTPAVRVNWKTLAGASYQVRRSTDLSNWTNFGNAVNGDGKAWSVIDTASSPRSFYQVTETKP